VPLALRPADTEPDGVWLYYRKKAFDMPDDFSFGQKPPGLGVGKLPTTTPHGEVSPEMAALVREKVGKIIIEEATSRDAAWTFLESVGISATNDAISQLVEAFLPALRIMCRRGYDPDGETWREGGWRGLLHEIRKKTARLMHRSWLGGRFDPDSALDLVNYAGMYYRLKNAGAPWGALGEPGSVETIDDVSMGDYSDLTTT
jgi:hypothetical protein